MTDELRKRNPISDEGILKMCDDQREATQHILPNLIGYLA